MRNTPLGSVTKGDLPVDGDDGNGSGGGNGGRGGGRGNGPGPNRAKRQDAPAGLKQEFYDEELGRLPLIPERARKALIEELRAKQEQEGLKISEFDTVVAFKNSDGNLLWLEYGSKLDEPVMHGSREVTYRNGAIHIYEKHEGEFEDRDVNSGAIVKTLIDVSRNGYVVDSGDGYEVRKWNGKNYLIAAGGNGYIRSFYPFKDEGQ